VGRRLLIIDETELSRRVLTQVFTQREYLCTAAGTIESGLRAIDEFKPDIVLYDWWFRDGSGTGLSWKIHARAEAAQLPIILVVLSVQSEPTGFREVEKIHDYFVKPLPARFLDSAFRMWLEQPGG
jgi:two-component system, cell cycle response regulator